MDLLASLRSRIQSLPDGDYTAGLRAVRLHVETSFAHLLRGQEQEEETAFTDAIYRTNQAFEGSIKEAYRVLAGQDPAKKSPFDIEKYLEDKNIFRERVLMQFTNYRTNWRNPSTHDYKLDFDESEAFLAIASVSAFACVLIDQIAERIAFLRSKKETDMNKDDLRRHLATEDVSLIELTVGTLKEFSKQRGSGSPIQSETQLLGALTGFFSAIVPSVKLTADYRLSSATSSRADLHVSNETDELLIELKRSLSSRASYEGVIQLEHYMLLSGIKQGILFVYPPSGGEVISVDAECSGTEGRIVILRSPEGDAKQRG